MDTMLDIRFANENDIGQFFPLVVEFATSFEPMRVPFEDAFRKLLADEHACVLVAANREKLVGYLLGFNHESFYANGPVSWVEEIAVSEDSRRIGAGTALMARFEEWAVSRGSRLAGLATRRAGQFYSHLGYDESAVYYRKLL